jgi:hypothetical protein
VTPAAEVRAVAAITTLSGGFGHTFTAHPAHSTLPANATSVELIPHSPGLPPSDFYTGELTLTSAAGVTKVPIAWEV